VAHQSQHHLLPDEIKTEKNNVKDKQITRLKEQIRYLKLKQRDKVAAALWRLKKQNERLQKHPANAKAYDKVYAQ
jgi:hypothetical protein